MDTELRVDARGLACPLPVVKTKKAIENIDSGKVVAIVDNTVARDNIMKLAQGLSLPVDVVADGTDFILSIMKGGGVAVAEPETGSEAAVLPERSGKNVVILFQADTIGRPEQELGDVLAKSFLYALTECTPTPRTLIFLNGGVRLTCTGSEALPSLKTLEVQGVEILSCGTCLDYLELKGELEVGTVSNMFSIIEKLMAADKVITVG
ncbi:MAG TPA: sulfurtransferase-like selenium metabolism protein YedF [Firmicutes bacterium]|jgi:selenium metabolism protein YedF|nr:sulfurtransferase-like selenium metabolism protein YedF [Bacillota bacterium]